MRATRDARDTGDPADPAANDNGAGPEAVPHQYRTKVTLGEPPHDGVDVLDEGLVEADDLLALAAALGDAVVAEAHPVQPGGGEPADAPAYVAGPTMGASRRRATAPRARPPRPSAW